MSVSGHRDTRRVISRRPKNLLTQIERDLLADKPLDTLLRKLILLGGSAGSAELRDWAATELQGYGAGADLPSYRSITAALQVDGAVPGGYVRHQTISPLDLPDFAQDDLNEHVPLAMSVRELRSMIEQHSASGSVQLMPPGSSSLVAYMNGQDHFQGHVTALYWTVSTIALEGVLDQIRTRLAMLIAELRSSTPTGQSLPSAAQATNAVHLVINGRGNRVNIAQASDQGTVTAQPEEPTQPFWTATRIAWSTIVGLATIAGATIALIQFM